jgi:hypothetical protein
VGALALRLALRLALLELCHICEEVAHDRLASSATIASEIRRIEA